MSEQQPNNQLNLEISEEVAEGQYANLAIITHSHAEFVVDFVNVMPGTPKSRVKSRIILTPQHAKRLLNALEGLRRGTDTLPIWRSRSPSLSLLAKRFYRNRFVDFTNQPL
jgi:hypothetical protein